MCFVFPFSSTSVLTILYPGISLVGLVPSSVSESGLPSLSTNEVSGRTVGV